MVWFYSLTRINSRCQRHQDIPHPQSCAYFTWGHSAFSPHSYYQKTRNSHVLHTVTFHVVYFTPSSISNEERAKIEVVSKADVPLSFRYPLVSLSQKDFTFIEHCGEFPNVPLLGMK